MPVISFASPKGGVGKTTASAVLASELALRGKGVTLIDADPNQPLSAWSKMPDGPDLVRVVSLPTGDPDGTIIDAIDTAATQTPFVVVDLEGTASMAVAYAISRSDLVLVPMQGSQLDAAQAARALRLVAQQERAFRRGISHAVLITRTSAAIQPRNLRHLLDELQRNGVTVIDTQLHEREAFKAMFAFGGTLHTLGPSQVSGLDAARQNASSFAGEVVNLLRAARKGAA